MIHQKENRTPAILCKVFIINIYLKLFVWDKNCISLLQMDCSAQHLENKPTFLFSCPDEQLAMQWAVMEITMDEDGLCNPVGHEAWVKTKCFIQGFFTSFNSNAIFLVFHFQFSQLSYERGIPQLSWRRKWVKDSICPFRPYFTKLYQFFIAVFLSHLLLFSFPLFFSTYTFSLFVKKIECLPFGNYVLY